MDYALAEGRQGPAARGRLALHTLTVHPLGMKGVGEGGAIAPERCLANAVSDALAPLGVAVNATPITPESVLKLIHAASR